MNLTEAEGIGLGFAASRSRVKKENCQAQFSFTNQSTRNTTGNYFKKKGEQKKLQIKGKELRGTKKGSGPNRLPAKEEVKRKEVKKTPAPE